MRYTPKAPDWKLRRKLLDRLQKEVNKLHGKDSDGDKYASVEVHDRRDGQWPYIQPVPRIPWEDPTSEDFMAAIEAATGNVSSASSTLDVVMRDVRCYFERNSKMKTYTAIAEKVLGETAVVGNSCGRYDDSPAWHVWKPYQVLDTEAEGKPHFNTSYYKENQFNPATFAKWLKDGKRTLAKLHGKLIKGWYVRIDGVVGITLSCLRVTPEAERPYHIARNRSKREFLEEHANEIEARAHAIESELRAKAKK